jgi:hypothetical protein
MYRLDSKPYMDKVRRTAQLAERALRHYGEPSMSLEELRTTLDRELKGVSLSELIIKERESGW